MRVTHQLASNQFSLAVGRGVERCVDIAALAAEMKQKAGRFRDATSYINHAVETVRQMMLPHAMSSIDSISQVQVDYATLRIC